jgi:Protein of unknown function (DUF3363)
MEQDDPRPPREERWDVPSGRVRAPAERPISLRAALRRLQRSRGSGQRRYAARTPRAFDASARRAVVRVRVVHVNQAWGKKAAKLNLRYLERDGVQQDGSPGKLYGEDGPVERRDFAKDLEGEEHQFRLMLSPEDGHELELEEYVRTYMARIEKDLGQKLRWAAANHYNTDEPHAHIVIRGIDANGAEVRMGREYVAHGLRQRAIELATEELGPRPERSRIDQLKREAGLERYTSLDRALEKRAEGGLFRFAPGPSRDPHMEAALRTRLEVLTQLGLVTKSGRSDWKLHSGRRAELDRMGRRADAMRVIRSVLPVSPSRCRLVDRAEPPNSEREELERGVQGVCRWKGLDEAGQFCAVIETVGGVAYHLPVSGRVAADVPVGQVLDLKRAIDKDQKIEDVARPAGWSYDVATLPEGARGAYRARLEQLERMRLAARDPAAPERWRLVPDFRAQVAKLAAIKPQPYWQMLSVRPDSQSLDDQTTYTGYVWLDRVRRDALGSTGFGREVREGLDRRADHLRGLGLEPQDGKLRWQLLDLQRRVLERKLVERGGPGLPSSERPRVSVAVQPSDGFEGTAHVHVAANGQQFLAVRAPGRFAVVPVMRDERQREGQVVRLRMEKGRLRSIETLGPERERGGPERGG